MDFDSYQQLSAVNFSALKLFAKSPRHYRFAVSQPSANADHFKYGRALHTFVLEPEKFRGEYVPYDGRRAGKAWDEFQAEHAGCTIMTRADYDSVIDAGRSILADPVASRYLGAGLRESTVVWTDPDTGVACKGRPDCVGGYLVDLKTTADLDERAWVRSVLRYWYHAQASMYLDGLRANRIDVDPEPIHVVVEKAPPYDVVVYRIPEPVVGLGRAAYKDWLQQLVTCRVTGSWPGRSLTEKELVLPEYAYATGDDGLELVMSDGEAVSL